MKSLEGLLVDKHTRRGRKRRINILAVGCQPPTSAVNHAAAVAEQRGWKNVVVQVDGMDQTSYEAVNLDQFYTNYDKGRVGIFVGDVA